MEREDWNAKHGEAGPLFGVLGDLNGDGKSDLAVANECQTNTPPCTGAVVALLGNGNGTLQAPANFLADSGVFLASSAAVNSLARPLGAQASSTPGTAAVLARGLTTARISTPVRRRVRSSAAIATER